MVHVYFNTPLDQNWPFCAGQWSCQDPARPTPWQWCRVSLWLRRSPARRPVPAVRMLFWQHRPGASSLPCVPGGLPRQDRYCCVLSCSSRPPVYTPYRIIDIYTLYRIMSRYTLKDILSLSNQVKPSQHNLAWNQGSMPPANSHADCISHALQGMYLKYVFAKIIPKTIYTHFYPSFILGWDFRLRWDMQYLHWSTKQRDG